MCFIRIIEIPGLTLFNLWLEQNLVDCSVQFGNHGGKGGQMQNCFRYIQANKGIELESTYPYQAKVFILSEFKSSNFNQKFTK